MRRLILLCAALFAAACASDRSFTDGLDDTGIDLALKRDLLGDDTIDTKDVDITVFEGRVLLSGTVRSVEARRALSQKAAAIGGVDDVLNELIVGGRTGMGQGAKDAYIDDRLGAALLADKNVFKANYRIAVSQGVVYLLGVAQGPEELTRVTAHAQDVAGVREVVTHILFVGDPRRRGY